MKATPVPSQRAAFLALGAVSAGAVALSGCGDRDEAEDEVARIEQRLGVGDLSRFTAPAPPAA